MPCCTELYKVVVTNFDSADKILIVCDHSSVSYGTMLSCACTRWFVFPQLKKESWVNYPALQKKKSACMTANVPYLICRF